LGSDGHPRLIAAPADQKIAIDVRQRLKAWLMRTAALIDLTMSKPSLKAIEGEPANADNVRLNDSRHGGFAIVHSAPRSGWAGR
jgi:hypothetical protein